MPRTYCVLLILVVTFGALVLRVPRLRQRPMHCDEAVHAEKFNKLLEEGTYVYDPLEYHGPTLNYLTLVPAWLSGEKKYTEIDEFTLRIVPVFFGVLLVFMPLLIADGLGRRGAILAAALTAVSPAMVYYSRYYVQEMLLVCFTFGVIVSGYRFVRSPRVIWAVLIGAFLGLMHATKETCIIAYGAMFLAMVFVLLLRRREGIPTAKSLRIIKPRYVIAVIAAGGIFAGVFFSSFFDNIMGVPDSFRTFLNYFTRAGSNPLHINPWYFYLKMLFWSQYGDGPVWSEGLIVVLAVVGFVAVMRKKGPVGVNQDLLRFLAFYVLIMTVVYSIIPYKTPWCFLGFLHGMILLAGVGTVWLLQIIPKRAGRILLVGLLAVGGGHLLFQAYRGSYQYYDDPRNPYVYAHTTSDVYKITACVEQIAQFHPDGHNMHIQVFFPHNYWPLPWYLRSFNPRNIHWDKQIPIGELPAPVILADPDLESQLLDMFYKNPPPGQREMYVPLFIDPSGKYLEYLELRPRVEIRGYVPKSLWDKMEQND